MFWNVYKICLITIHRSRSNLVIVRFMVPELKLWASLHREKKNVKFVVFVIELQFFLDKRYKIFTQYWQLDMTFMYWLVLELHVWPLMLDVLITFQWSAEIHCFAAPGIILSLILARSGEFVSLGHKSYLVYLKYLYYVLYTLKILLFIY